MLRRFVEQISRKVVLKKRLPAEFSRLPLYVSPDSALKFWKPGFGAELKELLRIAKTYVRTDDSVWDIGANVGVFTFGAAARCGAKGKVLAVEADTWLAVLLQRSRILPQNLDKSIEILCAAVSDENRILNFQIAERGRSANALEKSGRRAPAGGVRYSQPVPSYTLDCLLERFAPPNVLKIDVEGAELLVLQGAKRLLKDVRPIIYCEVGEDVSQEVYKLFREAGYRVYDGDNPKLIEQSTATWATLAFPEESVQEWIDKSLG